jgi:flagellar M-ring protein FliF
MATGTQLEMNTPPQHNAQGSAAEAVPGAAQWTGQLSALKARAQLRWAEMEPRQRFWAMAAAGLLVALTIFLAWYGLHTDWRVLYTGLDAEDARQMEQTLAAAQIPFDVGSKDGTVRVPSAQLDKARLATAAKGGVKSGRMGFEIFDKPNWVGSEFDEQVNYQRALEGELEHTIGTLADVESARVNLVMMHDSLFREQERPAKAAVVLKLRHPNLADGEAEAIRNMVASAVDGLSPDHVALVDAAGHLPLGPKTPEAMRLTAEQALEEKLIATLEPVTGTGNVRASVTLDYDPSATDVTAESYDPEKSATLSMQRTEQTAGAQPVAAGIPGTASNAPNTQALPVYPQVNTPPQSAKTETATYGVSKITRHTIENPGKIHRLTAAIVVNDRMVQPASGSKAAVWQSRSPEELRNLTALAQAAVGFDNGRGDTVAVEDLAFDENRGQTAVSPLERAIRGAENSPVLIKYGALVAAVLLVLALGVRPALSRSRSAKQAAPAVAELPAPHDSEFAALDSPDSRFMTPEMARAQEIFAQISETLKREPAQSSRLLQSWIHSDSQ